MRLSCPCNVGISAIDARKMLTDLLRTDEDLDAFCLDYAPEAFTHFSAGMSPVAKLNKILQTLGPAVSLQKLLLAYPEKGQRWLCDHNIVQSSGEELQTGPLSNPSHTGELCVRGLSARPVANRRWLWMSGTAAMALGAGLLWLRLAGQLRPARGPLLQPELVHVSKPGAPFNIHKTEVTVGQYQACVQTGQCRPASSTVYWEGIEAADILLLSPFCNAGKPGRENHPINCISWQEANEYCTWVGMRLPTGDEWEYAATGGDGRRYPWGDEPPTVQRLNACDDTCVALADSQERRWQREGLCRVQMVPKEGLASEQLLHGSDGYAMTAPVGSYPGGVSAFGLMDMAGNVREWTSESQYTCWNGRCRTTYLLRGGGYLEVDERDVRASTRTARASSELRVGLHGFRCAQTVLGPNR